MISIFSQYPISFVKINLSTLELLPLIENRKLLCKSYIGFLHNKLYNNLINAANYSALCTFFYVFWERSGSVVECLTGDRGVAGSSLTCVTVLCP